MGRVTNVLVTLRCVDERDKSVSLGLGVSAISLFAFIPGPIFFGYLIGNKYSDSSFYLFLSD